MGEKGVNISAYTLHKFTKFKYVYYITQMWFKNGEIL